MPQEAQQNPSNNRSEVNKNGLPNDKVNSLSRTEDSELARLIEYQAYQEPRVAALVRKYFDFNQLETSGDLKKDIEIKAKHLKSNSQELVAIWDLETELLKVKNKAETIPLVNKFLEDYKKDLSQSEWPYPSYFRKAVEANELALSTFERTINSTTAVEKIIAPREISIARFSRFVEKALSSSASTLKGNEEVDRLVREMQNELLRASDPKFIRDLSQVLDPVPIGTSDINSLNLPRKPK